MNNQAARFSQNIDSSSPSIYYINPKALLAKCNPQHFKKKETIFLPDETSNKLYFIIQGKVKMGIHLDSGRSVTRAILGEGDIFGESILLGIKKHKFYAHAMTAATIAVIPLQELNEMIQNNKDLTFFLMQKMGSNLLEKEQQIESVIFKNSRTRIIEFLLEFARKKGRRVGYEQLVNNMMTHQEIADLTATSRQTVTTTISELKNKNILIMNRKRMLIRDMDKLAKEWKSEIS